MDESVIETGDHGDLLGGNAARQLPQDLGALPMTRIGEQVERGAVRFLGALRIAAEPRQQAKEAVWALPVDALDHLPRFEQNQGTGCSFEFAEAFGANQNVRRALCDPVNEQLRLVETALDAECVEDLSRESATIQ